MRTPSTAAHASASMRSTPAAQAGFAGARYPLPWMASLLEASSGLQAAPCPCTRSGLVDGRPLASMRSAAASMRDFGRQARPAACLGSALGDDLCLELWFSSWDKVPNLCGGRGLALRGTEARAPDGQIARQPRTVVCAPPAVPFCVLRLRTIGHVGISRRQGLAHRPPRLILRSEVSLGHPELLATSPSHLAEGVRPGALMPCGT